MTYLEAEAPGSGQRDKRGVYLWTESQLGTRGLSLGMGEKDGHDYLYSIFQRSLWVHNLLSDGSVGGFEPVILFFIRMVDDVLCKLQQGLLKHTLYQILPPHTGR